MMASGVRKTSRVLVLLGILAVDLLGLLQDLIGILGLAMPELSPGQALVGDQILGRQLQQVLEARLGFLPVPRRFSASMGNATDRLLFHGRLAVGVRVLGNSCLALSKSIVASAIRRSCKAMLPRMT